MSITSRAGGRCINLKSGYLVSKKSVKSFLGKMLVIGERVLYSLALHVGHRNTVSQTIPLVGPGFIQDESQNEGIAFAVQ